MGNYIKREEVGDYRITIFPDECAECPITNWDMVGCYLFEYNRIHKLSDHCNWREVWGKHGDNKHSLAESMAELVRDYCDFDKIWDYFKSEKMSSVRLNYDRTENLWKISVYGYGVFDIRTTWSVIAEIEPSERVGKEWYVFDELFASIDTEDFVEIINQCGKDIYVAEWSTTGYSQGDYVGGVAFVTKERYDKYHGDKAESWKDVAQECIDGEVKCIEKWMWGDVIGYQLERKVRFKKVYEDPGKDNEDGYEWEEVDSCWGYYMEPEELIEEIIAEHNIKENDAV